MENVGGTNELWMPLHVDEKKRIYIEYTDGKLTFYTSRYFQFFFIGKVEVNGVKERPDIFKLLKLLYYLFSRA